MRIRYEATISDQLAVYQHQAKSNTNSKKSRVFSTGLAIFYALLGLFFIAQGEWFLSPMMFICAAVMLLTPRFMAKSMGSRVVKTMLKGDNARGVLGLHELEITPDGFIDRTEWKETKYAWAMLDHIETEGEHTFLTFGKANVIVIPHKSVTEGSLPAFIKALGEHYTPEAAGKMLALTQE